MGMSAHPVRSARIGRLVLLGPALGAGIALAILACTAFAAVTL